MARGCDLPERGGAPADRDKTTADSAAGGRADAEGLAVRGGSEGGAVSIEGGLGANTGGAVSVTSGVGTADDSGSMTIATADSGSSGERHDADNRDLDFWGDGGVYGGDGHRKHDLPERGGWQQRPRRGGDRDRARLTAPRD